MVRSSPSLGHTRLPRQRRLILGLLCGMLLIVGSGMVVPHHIAHAAPPALPPGYALTVTESTATIIYGDTPPNFQAHLTVPAGDNPLTNPGQFTFLIDTQAFSPDGHTQNGSTYTFTLRGTSLPSTPPLIAGQHSVVAQYFSIVLHQTLASAPITLTVQKRTPSLNCEVQFLPTFAINSAVTFTLSTTEVGPPIDWQDATYTITFLGSQTFTDTNLTGDSAGQVSAVTPPVPGKYHFRCTFNGTANFNAASVVGSSTLVVSANHQPAIKLYSNPTTITGGQTATLEIVVAGASGLATPTGQVSLNMGGILFTKPITLGPGGSVEFQIAFPSNLPANTIWVDYFGDIVYASDNVNFPLTNPPIPAGSNSPTPTPRPAPTSTASSAPTPSGGSTPASNSTSASSSTTTANDGAAAGSHPPAATSTQGSLVVWLVVLVLLLLAAGGSGVFLVRRKRARGAALAATTTLPPGSED